MLGSRISRRSTRAHVKVPTRTRGPSEHGYDSGKGPGRCEVGRLTQTGRQEFNLWCQDSSGKVPQSAGRITEVDSDTSLESSLETLLADK